MAKAPVDTLIVIRMRLFLFFYVSQVEHSYEYEIFENGFIFAGTGTFN